MANALSERKLCILGHTFCGSPPLTQLLLLPPSCTQGGLGPGLSMYVSSWRLSKSTTWPLHLVWQISGSSLPLCAQLGLTESSEEVPCQQEHSRSTPLVPQVLPPTSAPCRPPPARVPASCFYSWPPAALACCHACRLHAACTAAGAVPGEG